MDYLFIYLFIIRMCLSVLVIFGLHMNFVYISSLAFFFINIEILNVIQLIKTIF